jgi:hypothetical protein
METNTPYSSDITIEKTVERKKLKDGDVALRSRLNSFNEKVYLIVATEDDLLNKQNALVSKAIRTNGLRLVPGDIVEECMELVIKTQKTADAADPDAAKRKIFDSFATIGVGVEQLKSYLGHEAETLNPKELMDLRALFSAIRDGEANWRDVMDSVPKKKAEGADPGAGDAGKKPFDALKDKVAGKAAEFAGDNPAQTQSVIDNLKAKAAEKGGKQ